MKEQDEKELLDEITGSEYKYGFVSDLDADEIPKGLNEDVVRIISSKKNEPQWLLNWRLKAFRHWKTLTEPKWGNVNYPEIDFQDYIYYSAPKKKSAKSLDEIDPELKSTFEKLGISLEEHLKDNK